MDKHLETLLAHLKKEAGVHDPYAASHIPIYQTATFDIKSQQTEAEYGYSRSESPTREVLDRIFAIAEEGAGAVCTHTGIGAVLLLLETVLRAGDHMLIEEDIYGGTYRALEVYKEKYDITVHSVDCTDHAAVEAVLQAHPVKLFLCETPTNPGVKVLDLQELSALCHKHDVLTAVDNSLATFASQKPLTLGADFSLFSATKFLTGHGASISGALVSREQNWADKAAYQSNASGRNQGPFDTFLVSLGLPTLPIRLAAHEKSAMELATFLSEQSWVSRVSFPGLPSHPAHELARRQMKHIPGLIAFDADTEERAERLVKQTKIIQQKFSFGSADSRISQPARMSHATYSAADLKKTGLTGRTLRLSVGLEHVDDLRADLQQAVEG